MKMRSALVLTLMLALLATPALLRAQKTSYDYDSTANFSGFRTYAWRGGTPAPEAFLHQRIVAAIESQLAAKGLTRNDTNPDMYVSYHVAMEMKKSISGFGSAYGHGPLGLGLGGGVGSLNLDLNEIPMGTIVIDLGDAARQQLVWRGMGVKDIDFHAKPEKRDASIVKAVTKILKNYPPGSGKR